MEEEDDSNNPPFQNFLPPEPENLKSSLTDRDFDSGEASSSALTREDLPRTLPSVSDTLTLSTNRGSDSGSTSGGALMQEDSNPPVQNLFRPVPKNIKSPSNGKGFGFGGIGGITFMQEDPNSAFQGFLPPPSPVSSTGGSFGSGGMTRFSFTREDSNSPFQRFMRPASGNMNSSLIYNDPDPGPRLSGTKRSLTEFTNSNPSPGPSSSHNPNPHPNPDPNPNISPDLNPNKNPNQNPSHNPNLSPNQNTNFIAIHNPNQNPSHNPNLNPNQNVNFIPIQNPNVNPSHNPNLNTNQNANFIPIQNPNQNPSHNPNLNPNQNANIISIQNPNLNHTHNPNLNPNQNTNFIPIQNPNLNPNHNPNLNPGYNPNLNPNLKLSPIRNPSPNPNQGMPRNMMGFLNLSNPQSSIQQKANHPRMASRLPPPPPRRIPPAVDKLTRNCEAIRSLLLSCEPVVVPDDATFPGATKVVLKQVKKPQASGSTSNSSVSAALGKQMTILYGTQSHVFENVHPTKVRQIMSYAASPGPPMPTSQGSSSTTSQANSTKLLANSAPIPGTELRLNVGPSEVIQVDDSSNQEEALPGKSTEKEPDAQPPETENSSDPNMDQTKGKDVQPPQE